MICEHEIKRHALKKILFIYSKHVTPLRLTETDLSLK